MNSFSRALSFILALWVGSAWVGAQTRIVIQADRTNVRSKPSLDAEILASLNKGQEVTVLGEVTPPKGRETWSRIAMPEAVTVWVYEPLVNTKTGKVRAKELNYRAGPGRNYSVLGELKQGASIKVIREFDGWVQIEPPANAVAYVASRLLGPSVAATPASTPAPTRTIIPEAPYVPPAPVAKPQPQPAPEPAAPKGPLVVTPASELTPLARPASTEPTNPPPVIPEAPVITSIDPAPEPTPTPAPEPEPPLPATQSPAGAEFEQSLTPVAETNAPVVSTRRLLPLGSPRARSKLPPPPADNPVMVDVPPAPKIATWEPRFVIREGKVTPTVSIQAPTDFELRDGFYGEGPINYLLLEPQKELRQYVGKRVVVSGHEYYDSRWRLPVLKVEKIELAP
ncbi:MAG: SH3 domain-containing protein [Verrucomicrobia bacterium]|nr:SH3 domain-containing protein [Verrucomicrobiota bacterium]